MRRLGLAWRVALIVIAALVAIQIIAAAQNKSDNWVEMNVVGLATDSGGGREVPRPVIV